MTVKTEDLLDQPLSSEHVSSRKQGGMTLSYIEGHHVLREANRIFGFSGWEQSVDSLITTNCGTNEKGNHIVSSQAMVTITALGRSRTDVGYGTGIARDLAGAHESAGKEAVTDGMKRAFRTFGDQFGNALYDKEKKHVLDAEAQKRHDRAVKMLSNMIDKCESLASLRRLYSTHPDEVRCGLEEEFKQKAECFPDEGGEKPFD